MQAPIPLRVANKVAYVWDVDNIATLRSKYRICGILVGTLPHLSQQNVFLGIPLVLMPEEVVLLVDKGLAVLVDDPAAHQEPSLAELSRWEDTRKEYVKQQRAVAQAKETQAGQDGRAMSDEAVRKRKEREARKALQSAKPPEASLLEDGSPELTDPPPDASSSHVLKPQPLVRSSDHLPLSALPPYPVIIPASSSSTEWYTPNLYTYDTAESAKKAGIWNYPSTLHERAKCGVFKSLWEQNYFVGGGIKFGGDYLVYPGDPLRYHSHFVATVIDSPASALQPMEIVAHGRLGTATKKAHLLCGWDDEKQEVSCLSIEWAGFG